MNHENIRLRNYISLYVNSIIALMVFLGAIWMTTGWIPTDHPDFSGVGVEAFKYFTVLSNLLMGGVSVVLVFRNIFRLLGHNLKHSRFLATLNFAAVLGVTVTFGVVILFLAPTSANGFWSLYQESNLFFHMLVPLLALFDFLFLSGDVKLSWTSALWALLPVALYGIYYCVPLVKHAGPGGVIAKGDDWYRFFSGNTSYMPVRLIHLMVAVAALSFLLWFLYNLRVKLQTARAVGRSKNAVYHTVSKNLVSNVVTASEYYITTVIRIICVVAPLIGICAGSVFTTLWLTGSIESTFAKIFVFDCFCESYLVVALFLFNTCIGRDGVVITSKTFFGKTILTILLLLQWNLISYLVPFRDFWAYSILFLLLCALFLDSKLVLVNIIGHSASIAISLIVRGEQLLPAPGEDFASSMVFRLTLLALAFGLIYLLIHLVEKTLMTTLDKLSDYDALTHALNRRKLGHAIDEAIEQFTTEGAAFCVAIFDLDDFKQINDTYGHTKGDDVLVEFVHAINTAVSSNELVFRYGGEEFLVVFRGPKRRATDGCERILKGLRSTHFAFLPEDRCQTATVGVAQYREGMTADELIERADSRLYYGKQHGKNQVVSRDN